ncbi:hypothetical protein [Cryobacterium fucosi]|uniref:hypothetical protein n=1 Tax=Cryobacterium fucosi TaxID=1259157 RepID=UPI00141BDD77|nr:hypothetical protein [Cryobacterium fucosi]
MTLPLRSILPIVHDQDRAYFGPKAGAERKTRPATSTAAWPVSARATSASPT